MSIFDDALGGKGDKLDKGGSEAAEQAGAAQLEGTKLGIEEQRRQFDAVQQLLAPFIGAGRDSLGELQSGSSVDGFGGRIAQIMGSPAFDALVGKRRDSVNNHLSQTGLSRSGYGAAAAANIPAELAFALEDQLYGRTSNMVNLGQASATGQANAGMQTGANVADLLMQGGNAQAQAIIGAQQARAGGITNLMNAGMTAASIFFSDPRLKENMAPIGQLGDLTLYEWDWKPEVAEHIGEMSIGFNADEVAEKYPHHVVEIHGFRAIDYPSLTEELKVKYGRH